MGRGFANRLRLHRAALELGRNAMAHAGNGVNRLLSYAFAGSQFLFGDLGKQHSSYGSIVAFQVLPTIIFISAFFAVALSPRHHAAHHPRLRLGDAARP